jgi:hypothetical protein
MNLDFGLTCHVIGNGAAGMLANRAALFVLGWCIERYDLPKYLSHIYESACPRALRRRYSWSSTPPDSVANSIVGRSSKPNRRPQQSFGNCQKVDASNLHRETSCKFLIGGVKCLSIASPSTKLPSIILDP